MYDVVILKIDTLRILIIIACNSDCVASQIIPYYYIVVDFQTFIFQRKY